LGFFLELIETNLTYNVIGDKTERTLDLTVCHRWKSGGTPRPLLYRLRCWTNAASLARIRLSRD